MFFLGFLLSSVPFVLPFRGYPNGDFYPDALAVLLALLGVVFFRRFAFSGGVLFFLCLAGLMLASGFMMRGYYYDIWFLPALALAVYAVFLAGIVGLSEPIKSLFLKGCVFGLIFGGCVSLTIGYFQIFKVTDYLGWLVFPGGNGVYGNIAQRNLFSTYMLIFASALCGVLALNKMKCLVFLLPFIAFVLAYSGSRMVLLDALCLIFLFAGLRRWMVMDSRVIAFIKLMLIFLIFMVASQLLLLAVGEGGASRITLQGDAPRVGEWLKAWRIIVDNPLGVGFGNYARFSFVYQLNSGEVGSQITWTHAHNIVMQFLVEFGVWVLPLFIFFGCLFFRFFKLCLESGVKGVSIFCCVLPVIVHSFFEYPLWYMNFLLLFVVLFGVLDSVRNAKYVSSIRWGGVACLFCLVFVVVDYSKISSYREPVKDAKVNIQRLTDLLDISLNPALAWSADLALNEYLVADDGPEWEFKLCKSIYMAVREPLYPYLERVALVAIAGHDFNMASSVLKSRYALYPDMPDSYLKARIRVQWPSVADDYIEKIDSDRKAGYPDNEYYRLTIPLHCANSDVTD